MMIEVDNLQKAFERDGDVIWAVRGLSFSVAPGEVYGLMGPNGAGKTTTMRMMLGLLTPTDGEATIGGFRVSKQPQEVKRRIGFASTSSGLYPWLTVKEMLLFFADLYGLPSDLARARVDELTRVLEMEKFLGLRGSALSTGQKQRVTLARGLIHDPPAILLDEPTRGLDVIASKVVFDYIDHLRSQNKAVIVCTHRLEEAERLCDRFGLLHEGLLRHEGTLEELKAATGREALVEMFLDLLTESGASATSFTPLQEEVGA